MIRDVLPEKWKIKNNDIVGEWYNKQLSADCYTIGSGYGHQWLSSHNDYDGCIIDKTGEWEQRSYVGQKHPDEITFEEFEFHILNKKPETVQDFSCLIEILKRYNIR